MNDFRRENFYVITGGPGVGKTTLLNELAKRGFKIISEDAREIIKQQVERDEDGLPWKNKERFSQLMFEATFESYKAASHNNSETYFFDRGILDTLCYADMVGLGVSSEMDAIAKTYRYNEKVFMLPPWLEIYHTDNERKQTWQEAAETFIKMRETYSNYGYKIVELPKTTIESRADFVVERIKSLK